MQRKLDNVCVDFPDLVNAVRIYGWFGAAFRVFFSLLISGVRRMNFDSVCFSAD